MTTTTHNLEHLLADVDNNQPIRCKATWPHTCTTTARWICYGLGTCRADGKNGVSLWCDGRRQHQLNSIAKNVPCMCGQPQTHWTVIPL